MAGVPLKLCAWPSGALGFKMLLFLSCGKGLAFLLFATQEKRNIAFMQELQRLFALMLGTRRKFVDPSAALELLRDAFRSAEEQQVKPC